MSSTKRTPLVYIVFTALLSAMAFVLYLFEFPVVPAFSYLKMDFSDVPALIGGVIFGPVMGILIELIKNLIELLVRGMGSQMGWGNLMNFLVGCAYVVPFSIVWRKTMGEKYEFVHALAAMAAGIISILVVGIIGNSLVCPFFFKYFLNVELITDKTLKGAFNALKTPVLAATSVNAIKGLILSVISYPLLRAIIPAVKKITKQN